MGGLTIGMFWGLVVSAITLSVLSLSSPLPPRPEARLAPAPVVAPEESAPDTDTTPTPEEASTPAPGLDAPTPDAAPATPQDVALPAAGDSDGDGDATPATEVPLPSGSEFNRPPPEEEAALPATDAAPSVAAPQAPQGVGDIRAPRFDTAPAAQPDVGVEAPAPIGALASDADAPARPADDAPAPEVSGNPAAPVQPEAVDTPRIRTALLPQVTPPVAPDDAAGDVAARGEARVAPEASPDDGADAGATQVAPLPMPGATPILPRVSAEAPSAPSATRPASPSLFPQSSGLPRITPPGSGESAGTASDGATDAGPEAAADPSLPAIRAFAAPFDVAESRPLVSVILIDEPDGPIPQDRLIELPFPVAFALDPQRPDAAARAQAYRAAGFEVVMLAAMIPEGAIAVDTETALAGAQVILPEAVAILDTPEGRVQGDREVLDALVAALFESGHGLVAFPQGLNVAEQSAARLGVPAATVFRLLDDEDQSAPVITRFLARAAFTASQEGAVIVVGRTRPDTVTALFSWATADRTDAVALAPLSAALLRLSTP